MSLWDAITGKKNPWNKLWSDADEYIRQSLSHWEIAASATEPQAAPTVRIGRDLLYAYYTSSKIYLNAMTEGHLADDQSLIDVTIKGVYGLHLRGLLSLLRSLHTYSLMLEATAYCSSDELFSDELMWTHMQLTGVDAMYGCPAGYIQAWLERLDYFADKKHGSTRIGIYLYEHVAEIIGLPSWYDSNPLKLNHVLVYWMGTANDIAESRNNLYEGEGWSEYVCEALA